MKKDISQKIATDIALVVTKDINNQNKEEWNVYLLNLKNTAIDTILVSSKIYGKIEGRNIETDIRRHSIKSISSHNYIKVEKIP